MHDIDRVRLESDFENAQMESSAYESGPFEYEQFEYDEAEAPVYGEAEALFGEADEMDLASELLEVTSDQELDQFLGKLIKRAGRALGQVVRSPVGQAVGGLLKGAARQALPGIGSAIGGYLGGAAGARLGSQGAYGAGRMFGLELEGLSGEDQEFEVARRFVRFSGDTVKNLAQMPPGRDLLGAARAATIAAARTHAPGLLQPPAAAVPTSQARPMAGRGQSGKWMRRGNKIVLFGL